MQYAFMYECTCRDRLYVSCVDACNYFFLSMYCVDENNPSIKLKLAIQARNVCLLNVGLLSSSIRIRI